MFETNYAAIGLPDQSPFAVLTNTRPVAAPKAPQKTPRPLRTKAEWAAIGLETPEQRKTRQAQERANKAAQILKNNKYSESGYNTGKTNSEVAPR